MPMLQPSSHPALDQNACCMQPIPPQLLQYCNLSGPEEDLGLAKAVLLWIRNEIRKGTLTGTAHIIFRKRTMQQHPITSVEFLVCPPGVQMRESGMEAGTELRDLQKSTCLEGQPAALIRMVSKTPHARNCCTARLGSKLIQRDKRELIKLKQT